MANSRSGSVTQPLSLLFISPSTRENSTESFPDHPQMKKLSQVLQTLKHPHQVGTGYWSDGKEEVAVAKVPSEAVHKTAAKLGSLFNQKAVLYFTPGEGPDQLHKVTGASEPELTQRGIEYKTMLPNGDAYVVDSGGALKDKLAGLNHHSITGTANFLGADTREGAKEVYHNVLRS